MSEWTRKVSTSTPCDHKCTGIHTRESMELPERNGQSVYVLMPDDEEYEAYYGPLDWSSPTTSYQFDLQRDCEFMESDIKAWRPRY